MRIRTQSGSWTQWRKDLVEKLEAVHMLAIEADAFQSALEAVSADMPWPSDGDPERRRVLNRLGCFTVELNERLDALLRESREAVELAMQRVA